MPPHVPDTKSWRDRLRRRALIAFVVFHLVLFPVRNLLDMGGHQIKTWLNEHDLGPTVGRPVEALDLVTARYCNLVGCEQDWRMFGAPVARRSGFLAWRIELDDGSRVTVLSGRESPVGEPFFRVGDWQERKLEDYLLEPPAGRQGNGEWPLWEAAARRTALAWRKDHPDDPRVVRRVILVQRWYDLPPPEHAGSWPTVEETEVLAFSPHGRALP